MPLLPPPALTLAASIAMRTRTLPDGSFEIKTGVSGSRIKLVSASILCTAGLIGLAQGALVHWLLFGSFIVFLYFLRVSFAANAHIIIDEKKDLMIVRAGGRMTRRSYSDLIGLVRGVGFERTSRVGLEFKTGSNISEYFFFSTSYSTSGLLSNNDRLIDGLESLLKVRTNRTYERS